MDYPLGTVALAGDLSQVDRIAPYQIEAPILVYLKVYSDPEPYTWTAPLEVTVVEGDWLSYAVEAPLEIEVLGPGNYRYPYIVSGPVTVKVIGSYQAEAPLNISVVDASGSPFVPYCVVAPFSIDTTMGTPYEPPQNYYDGPSPYEPPVLDSSIRRQSRASTASPDFWGIKVLFTPPGASMIDLTNYLSGTVQVTRAENASATAEFTAYPVPILDGELVTDPDQEHLVNTGEFLGGAIKIWYLPTGGNPDSALGPLGDWHCLFGGYIDAVKYDSSSHLLSFSCTDMLLKLFDTYALEQRNAVTKAEKALWMAEDNKSRIISELYKSIGLTQKAFDEIMLGLDQEILTKQMELNAAKRITADRILAFVNHPNDVSWSPHIFSADASGWDTFTDIMSTWAGSVWIDPTTGYVGSTPWQVLTGDGVTDNPDPDWYIDSAQILMSDDNTCSLKIERMAEARDLINFIDVKFEYRYTRLFEYNVPMRWTPSAAYFYYATYMGIGVPDYARVIDAFNGAGYCAKVTTSSFVKYGDTVPITGLNRIELRPIPGPTVINLPTSGGDPQEFAYVADTPRFSLCGGAYLNGLRRYKQEVSEKTIVSVRLGESMRSAVPIYRQTEAGLECTQFDDARLSKVVEEWEETRSAVFQYPISRDGISLHSGEAAGNFASEIMTDATLTFNYYYRKIPSGIKTDKEVNEDLPELSRRALVENSLKGSTLETWSIDTNIYDGRKAANWAKVVAIDVAKRKIVEAHRNNIISFDTPMEYVHGIWGSTLGKKALDLGNYVSVDRAEPLIQALGMVKELTHTLSIDEGSATTHVVLALLKPWHAKGGVISEYVEPWLEGTKVYPGQQWTSRALLKDWPIDAEALLRVGGLGAPDPMPVLEEEARFCGFNWLTGEFTIQAPHTPMETQSPFIETPSTTVERELVGNDAWWSTKVFVANNRLKIEI